ncbi:hypothetical protein H2248_006391 [Termitomyces sp. 'cryptogamus']|nr:hypothetical protein H2248_006391 [Termitomyces sp. 'cryptogamus']
MIFVSSQQISSFFLGTVFITSLNYSFHWIRGLFPRVKDWILSRKRSPTNDLEKNDFDVASIVSLSTIRSGEDMTIVFAISLCFLFASIAYFSSLLSFHQNADATCAFLIAWGGVATQTAAIIGIYALLLELRALGIRNVEYYASLVSLFAEMVLVFTNNAIGTGALRSLTCDHILCKDKPFTSLDNAICYKKHFLPTALTTSLISLFLEIYVLLRLGVLLTRRAILASQRPACLLDSRVGKVLSLLLLNVLTIGPSAVHITLVADFVPLSIGALFVLWTFNTLRTMEEEKGVVVYNVNERPPLLRSTWFSTTSEGETRPTGPIIAHPFSDRYRRETARSSMTEEGNIQTVRRSAPITATSTVIATASETKTTSSPTSSKVARPESSARPTSLLMHPWHERRRKRRSSAGDVIRGREEFGYTVQGLSFPLPPVMSPTAGATRRYSSSTLGSPGFSQEGGEGRKVHLLTFASVFRK